MASTPDARPHTVMWFRRDLRLADNPALLEACDSPGVLPLFVLDPALWRPAGRPRRAYLAASLRALDAMLRQDGPGLTVRHGDPVHEVVDAARQVHATRVHVAADFGPYGARRDLATERALARHGIELVRTGSPYAVAPGRVRTGSGGPYQVYTPFLRAWTEHGWRGPVPAPTGVRWLAGDGVDVPDHEPPEGVTLPEAGEPAARRRWTTYLQEHLADYVDERNRPDLDSTSRMSVHLKWGEIHPRTMLADLAAAAAGPVAGPTDGPTDGPTAAAAAAYRRELAWREFYADVLHTRPASAREYLRPELAAMEHDEPGDRFDAWREGRTGFPIVDAGMRQLLATGWMHNRVRMITASFLVKDLHVEWQHGARHFMRHLVDGDLASNQHGWQWVAGSGTDAAPYFRVFNPTTQGTRFDPDGGYVRRWVPELRDVDPRHVHEPDKDPAGRPEGYPAPIVDHAAERRTALDRYQSVKQRGTSSGEYDAG
jgi:deoxyribodipyrimidine photo-lyase